LKTHYQENNIRIRAVIKILISNYGKTQNQENSMGLDFSTLN